MDHVDADGVNDARYMHMAGSATEQALEQGCRSSWRRCLESCGNCDCVGVASGLGRICTCGQGCDALCLTCVSVFTTTADPDFKAFSLPVRQERPATDAWFRFAFYLATVAMVALAILAHGLGRPEIYDNGVDVYGNVCGRERNPARAGIAQSGVNTADYAKVLPVDLLREPARMDNASAFGAALTLPVCVMTCPPSAGSFAPTCGQFIKALSPYRIAAAEMAAFCPADNGSTVAANYVGVDGRCVPKHALATKTGAARHRLTRALYGDNRRRNAMRACERARDLLACVALVAFAVTQLFVLVGVFRAEFAVWVVLILFVASGACAVGFGWVYLASAPENVAVYRQISPTTANSSRAPAANLVSRALLRGAFRARQYSANSDASSISLTVMLIVFTAVIIVSSVACVSLGRRNVASAGALFAEGSAGLAQLRVWVFLVPYCTLALVGACWLLWWQVSRHLVAIFKHDLRAEADRATSYVKHSHVANEIYGVWLFAFHALGMCWFTVWMYACQHFVVSSAVCCWYFGAGDKKGVEKPLRVATTRLVRNHLGSAAACAFLAGFFGFLRAPLSFMQLLVVASWEHVQITRSRAEGREEPGLMVDQGTPPSDGQPLFEEVLTNDATSRILYPYCNEVRQIPHSEDAYYNVPVEPANKTAKFVYRWSYGAMKLCRPMFWYLDNVLVYFSDTNLSMVALKGTSFANGGHEIRDHLRLRPNLRGVVAVVGYVLFVAKATVTIMIFPFAVLIMFARDDLIEYTYPIVLAAFISFNIAHIFLSPFQSAAQAIFVCFLEDIALNKGTQQAPYFGRGVFLQNFHNSLNEIKTRKLKQMIAEEHRRMVLCLSDGGKVFKIFPKKIVESSPEVRDPNIVEEIWENIAAFFDGWT